MNPNNFARALARAVDNHYAIEAQLASLQRRLSVRFRDVNREKHAELVRRVQNTVRPFKSVAAIYSPATAPTLARRTGRCPRGQETR